MKRSASIQIFTERQGYMKNRVIEFRSILHGVMMLVLVGLLTSCPPPPPTSETKIISFAADKTTIEKPGDPVQLSWEAVSATDECRLTSVDANGTTENVAVECKATTIREPSLKTRYQFGAQRADKNYETNDIIIDIGKPEPGNTAPVAKSQDVAADIVSGQPIEIILEGSDFENDTLSFSIVDTPTHGELSGSGANRTYTPDASFTSTDSFTFQVNDGQAPSNTAIVTITDTAQPFWEALGGAVERYKDDSSNQPAANPSLALKSNGNPVVAWEEVYSFSDTDVVVDQYDGSAWTPAGDWLDTTGSFIATNPSIAVGADDNPFVAYSENDGTNPSQIYVKKWDGSSWQPLGGSLNVGSGEAYTPSLVVLNGDTPIVAWSEFDGSDSKIYVKWWSTSDLVWYYYGTANSINTAGSAFNPSLALGSNGIPFLAWSESNIITTNNIYVKYWDGAQWSIYGSGGLSADISIDPGSARPSLQLTNTNTPVVTWQGFETSSNIYVKHCDSSDGVWTPYGGTSMVEGSEDSDNPALAVDNSDSPVVVFRKEGKIYARRWNGSSWVLLANELNATGDGYNPAIVIDGDIPVIAWEGFDGTSYSIYVKRYKP
jgi:Bacterial Ig domain